MDTVLPDAQPANWVDRYAPAQLKPWLKLARLDRPTGIWLLMLPGWQGIALAGSIQGRAPELPLLALFFAGAVLMRSAGCAYNDIVDKDLDAKVARTAMRPVASGQISVAGAWAFLVVCSLASLAILLSLNFLAVVLGVASLALVAAYPFMKRVTWWPQAWLGLTFNWGALLGYAAAFHPEVVAQDVTAVHFGPVLLLYVSLVFWTLGYDTIYAVQDLEDDALAGVKSSARRLGAGAPLAVLIFYLVSVALALAAGWTARLGVPFYVGMALYAAWLLRQPALLKPDDPPRALALFKSNTWAGVLLFAAIVASLWRP